MFSAVEGLRTIPYSLIFSRSHRKCILGDDDQLPGGVDMFMLVFFYNLHHVLSGTGASSPYVLVLIENFHQLNFLGLL